MARTVADGMGFELTGFDRRRVPTRGMFVRDLVAAAATIVAAGAPAVAFAKDECNSQSGPDVRELWLYRRETDETVRAPFTLDGVNIWKCGYYKLCIAFRDVSPGVDPVEGYVQVDPRMIDALWEIQRYYHSVGVDRPIEIYSGFRTPATNERVGGTTKSYHKLARAVDFSVQGVPIGHTGKVAMALPAALVGGLGIYHDDDHVHIDTGPRDGRVWCDHDEHTCSAAEI